MGPFQNCVRQTRLPFKMAAVTKDRNFFSCLLLLYYKSKWAKKNYCSYMEMSSLTYILGFSVKFFFQLIYTDYANWAYFDKRSHLNLLLWNRWTKLNQTWQGWSLDGSLSKLCPTAPALHLRWLLLLKIEFSSVVHCCFSICQNELKF